MRQGRGKDERVKGSVEVRPGRGWIILLLKQWQSVGIKQVPEWWWGKAQQALKIPR